MIFTIAGKFLHDFKYFSRTVNFILALTLGSEIVSHSLTVNSLKGVIYLILCLFYELYENGRFTIHLLLPL